MATRAHADHGRRLPTHPCALHLLLAALAAFAGAGCSGGPTSKTQPGLPDSGPVPPADVLPDVPGGRAAAPAPTPRPYAGPSVGFDWSSGCDGGSYSATHPIPRDGLVTVGSIPAGQQTIRITLQASADLDLRLYHADGSAIVSWPDGLLSGAASGSVELDGATYTYSGYEGDGTGAGQESIEISGVSPQALVVKAYGYAEGQAAVSYEWDAHADCDTVGVGSFVRWLDSDATAALGAIPAWLTDVQVAVHSPADLDIELHDADQTRVIHVLDGLLSGDTAQSMPYKGATVSWSGAGGDGSGRGNESVELAGRTTNAFVMKLHANAAGEAVISYRWTRGSELTAPTCADIPSATTAQQVQIVADNPSCAEHFVDALLANPWAHLAALYQLIPSSAATSKLFTAVYDRLYAGSFELTDKTVMDDLFVNLPVAVNNCTGLYPCTSWRTYILDALLHGKLYACPTLSGLSAAALLAEVPYGDYYCTEDVAHALAPLADSTTITGLLDLTANHAVAWSRRNAVRVIGRFAGRSAGDPARVLVTQTRATDVKDTLLTRLTADDAEDVLHDAIWVLDSFFYPYHAMAAALELITADTSHDTSLRFRAITVWARLLDAKSAALSQAEVDFIAASLASDDKWVRAEAAFICQQVALSRLTSAQESQLVAALQGAWAAETELVAQVYLAQALDRLTGSALFGSLQTDYEAAHLGNTLTRSGIALVSGLPAADLPPLLSRLEQERAAFFDILAAPFDVPVPGDLNSGIEVYIFATRAEYQEYMEAFIGYGAAGGGLYLEGAGILYTYERTPSQSSYTLEELLQHEFGHFLAGRYIFPGLWSGAGFHTQPKGWADEGLAELLAGLAFDGQGGYSMPLRSGHVAKLCATAFRDLYGLLALRAGYDQPGTFDYPNAWAFTYYLVTQHKPKALLLYGAFRDGTYSLSSFASIAQVSSVAALQSSWHTAMQSWCAAAPGPPGPAASPEPGPLDRVLRLPALPLQLAPRPTMLLRADPALAPQPLPRPGGAALAPAPAASAEPGAKGPQCG